jgi:hypothetical protein
MRGVKPVRARFARRARTFLREQPGSRQSDGCVCPGKPARVSSIPIGLGSGAAQLLSVAG